MKAIEIFQQEGNRTVGIFQDAGGEFLAITFSQSKSFKKESSARKWLAKYL